MCDLGKGTRTATHATSCSASRGGSHHSDADGGLSDALAFLITALPPSVVSLVGARQLIAFMLAFIASMGTFLGGIFVVILAQFRKSNATSTAWLVGVLQAFSGGVMLYMTFLDLIPESIEVIGGRETMIWFFVGVAVFGFLETYVVPEEHDHGDGEHDAAHEPSDDNSSNSAADGKESNTVATSDSTGLRNRKKSKSSDDSDKRKDAIKPSSGTSKREGGELSQKERRDLLRTSLITFLAMGLHNLPEGLGVYLSTLSNVRLGLELSLAIMLHNIPEGMAVAIPLWAASRSSFHILWMTFLNGFAEPIGVVVGGWFLRAYLTNAMLSKCLAAVGGIMACISIHELQPTALKYSGKGSATTALFVGMFVCFVALESVHDFMSGL